MSCFGSGRLISARYCRANFLHCASVQGCDIARLTSGWLGESIGSQRS